jgi:hypothetical protein
MAKAGGIDPNQKLGGFRRVQLQRLQAERRTGAIGPLMSTALMQHCRGDLHAPPSHCNGCARVEQKCAFLKRPA